MYEMTTKTCAFIVALSTLTSRPHSFAAMPSLVQIIVGSLLLLEVALGDQRAVLQFYHFQELPISVFIHTLGDTSTTDGL
jgi:hypothetical protein